MPVVCDFGYAGYTTDTRGSGFLTDKHAHPQPWEDIHLFGRMIYSLCARSVGITTKPKSHAVELEKVAKAGLSPELL